MRRTYCGRELKWLFFSHRNWYIYISLLEFVWCVNYLGHIFQLLFGFGDWVAWGENDSTFLPSKSKIFYIYMNISLTVVYIIKENTVLDKTYNKIYRLGAGGPYHVWIWSSNMSYCLIFCPALALYVYIFLHHFFASSFCTAL